jgi:hypothetical protein
MRIFSSLRAKGMPCPKICQVVEFGYVTANGTLMVGPKLDKNVVDGNILSYIGA